MPISDLLIPEFDAESATTRRVLERVPDAKADFKPHPKSFSMAHLAQLVSMLPSWVPMTLTQTELDLEPPGKPKTDAYSNQPIAKLLADFDKHVAAGREALAKVTDEELMVPWTLKRAGKTLMTQTRYEILRVMVLNHTVHHRAQLSTYLRDVDVPVPQMYGPTADDKS